MLWCVCFFYREVGRINSVLFQNERVVSVMSDSIAINTDLLRPLNTTTIVHHVVYNTPPVGVVSPVMVHASPPPPPTPLSQPVMAMAVPINESQPVSNNEKFTTVSNPAYQNTGSFITFLVPFCW